ncbi:GHKL domain-containing protein [Lysinibacillus sp. SGAir0095]|uniref:sensor histidine kinase n=1 Tax=Lysinibacillus sp. SGAir0095 TaxID=2070463 RepID=UPI0010CCE267|nr:GHKL domain-containing protein [Lysinibacillus sp. SGAir0095]QCR33448.1 hypothetical protein C1N55_15400 [Lysinibacillus sp. SGAir0095]
MKLLFLVIEFSLIFWAITFTSQIKVTIKRVLAYILMIICPTTISFLIIGQWVGIIFLIVSSFIYFFWLSRGVLTLIHICFVVILGVLTDNLTQFVMMPFPNNVLPGNLEHYCVFIILFIASILIYQVSSKKIYQFFGEEKPAYVFVLFLTLLTMSTFYINIYLTEFLTKDTLLKFNIITQLTYFGIMCFVLYITIMILKKQNHFKKVEFETAQFTDYMNSLELINNDMQKFRHDYANILFTMQGYMEINDFEGLKKYFKKHIFSAEQDTLKRNQRLSNLSNLQIMGIKGLILTKTLQAEKEGIDVEIEIPGSIDEISMNVIDISRILGIFLDNAIEANTQVIEHKEINIAIYKSMSDSIIIIIENTLNDDSPKVEQLFTDGFSTKGENRGKGLSTVKSIIDQYPNVLLNTTVHDGVFSHVIEVAFVEKEKELNVLSV